MRVFPEPKYQQVLKEQQIDTFLPAFLISQKSEIFDSFPPGEAFGRYRANATHYQLEEIYEIRIFRLR